MSKTKNAEQESLKQIRLELRKLIHGEATNYKLALAEVYLKQHLQRIKTDDSATDK